MPRFLRFSILTLVAFCLSACGPSNSTRSTFDGPAFGGPAFGSVLVIGIAGDFNSRADFERMLAREIATGSTTATPYYTLVEVDAPIDLIDISTDAHDQAAIDVPPTRYPGGISPRSR